MRDEGTKSESGRPQIVGGELFRMRVVDPNPRGNRVERREAAKQHKVHVKQDAELAKRRANAHTCLSGQRNRDVDCARCMAKCEHDLTDASADDWCVALPHIEIS